MQCPACKDVTLVMSDRQGVEVDYCPQCRGVWLDRGELDKIIERSAALEYSSSPPRGQAAESRRDYDDYDRRGHQHRRRKKKGLLGEIFDFD